MKDDQGSGGEPHVRMPAEQSSSLSWLVQPDTIYRTMKALERIAKALEEIVEYGIKERKW